MPTGLVRRRPISEEDERAIAAVLVRYATGIDRRDWSLFRTCFAEDCEADYGDFGQWRGPREITDYMRDAHAQLGPTLHRITNIVVECENDDVRARSYVDAILRPAVERGDTHRAAGYYDDFLTRTSDGWKIYRRKFTVVQLS
jgi:3-phenylpropionate/cinnamic acid dioxygenase small subunit